MLHRSPHPAALLLLASFGCASAPHLAGKQGSLAITGVTVIDPSRTADTRGNQTIVIADGRIVAVGDPRDVSIPAGAGVVDARGKFAIPGLWDVHVHFMNTGPSALPLYVANGITRVREMGGYLDSTRAWQGRIAAGTLVGPRIRTPGPILENPRYLAGVRQRDVGLGGRLAPRVLPYRVAIADSADARRVMDSLASLKVDFVKIRTVASRDAYLAILAQAKRVGLSVAGHFPGVVDIVGASDAGQKSLEHGIFPPLSMLPDSLRAALYARLARNGTWYTPTLTVSRGVMVGRDSAERLIFGPNATALDSARLYASPWLLGWWRMQVDERVNEPDSVRAMMSRAYASNLHDIRAMANAGVRILAGTDAGSVLVYPGFALHEELRLLVEDAKLTPKEALWSATVGPSVYFGMEKELGTIEPGRIADIVLLDADPLADIKNTRRIFAVIQGGRGGRLFDRAALDALLLGVRRDVGAAR